MVFDGFRNKACEFLQEIEDNNNKIWFENNRHIWEKEILEPNQAYVEDMGETLLILNPMIKAKAKVSGSLFKIYRDVRFSKDKTPIKTKIGIMFWLGEAHRMQSASFYMQYKKDEVMIATGIRGFKAPLLKAYREYIKIEQNAIALHEILETFKKDGIKIVEPTYKRYPKDFNKDDKYAYLSLYSSMFVYKTFKPNKTFFSKKIVNHNFKFYDKTYILNEWLYDLTLKVQED